MKKLSYLLLLIPLLMLSSCGETATQAQDIANSGVKQTTVRVTTDVNGKTIEQNNIAMRLTEDNKPGSIKHLYILSAYSGQVLLYSTVKGKVTSSGKRLSPALLAKTGTSDWHYEYNPDLIQDDGTYGSSVDYVYWWDSKGIYHQQYVTGGMIMHISNQPIAVKSVILNLELNTTNNSD